MSHSQESINLLPQPPLPTTSIKAQQGMADQVFAVLGGDIELTAGEEQDDEEEVRLGRGMTFSYSTPLKMPEEDIVEHEPATFALGSPGATGLVNLGNTCYMRYTVLDPALIRFIHSALIQVLSNCVPFSAYILGHSWKKLHNHEEDAVALTPAFDLVLSGLWIGKEIVYPSHFKEVVASLNKKFSGYVKQLQSLPLSP